MLGGRGWLKESSPNLLHLLKDCTGDWTLLYTGYLQVLFCFSSQMQNAMQVKPAENESRSGKVKNFFDGNE